MLIGLFKVGRDHTFLVINKRVLDDFCVFYSLLGYFLPAGDDGFNFVEFVDCAVFYAADVAHQQGADVSGLVLFEYDMPRGVAARFILHL